MVEVFCKKRCSVFLEISQNSQKNTCAAVSVLIKLLACMRPATLLKKRLWHRCFLVNFAKFLRTPSLQNTFGRLLLFVQLLVQSDGETYCCCYDLLAHMIEITAKYVELCRILSQNFLSLSKIYVTVIMKERFPAGKTKLVWEASIRCHTFC